MKISDAKVMKSAAGWYVGRTYYDEECQCDLPYDRLSDYCATKSTAEAVLAVMMAAVLN